MNTKAFALAMTCGALSFGCAAQPEQGSADETQEIIDNLVQAGFPASDIQVFDGKVFTGFDAEVSLQASREMIATDPSSSEEQYRTTNLLSTAMTTICINGTAYTGSFSTALNNAITAYNNLGLRFTMRRTTGSTTGCSATITARTTSGTGGVSGFPSGGRPFNAINIGTGLTSFATSTITHVIIHEIGHTLGMRHTDFFNRSISCGGAATNEGDGGVGAILISGTPSGATVGGSVMNSCFRSNETGRFTSSDVTAWTTVY